MKDKTVQMGFSRIRNAIVLGSEECGQVLDMPAARTDQSPRRLEKVSTYAVSTFDD
jgi:hypothetical protein